MPKNEIQPLPKRGNIALGPELLKSLVGIDRCRAFFDQLELVDYLKSINSFYLENKGKIVGPTNKIAAGIIEKDDNETEGFQLNNSWGGINVHLEWDKNSNTKGSILLSLKYAYKTDYYDIFLSGGTSVNDQGNGLSTTTSFHRTFRLNPPSITQNDIDSILLAYTNELLEAKII